MRRFVYGLCFIFLSILIACGSEDIVLGTPTGSIATTTATTATTTPPVRSAEHPYLRAPNVPNCDEGALSQDTKDRALRHINDIRTLHGLKPVIYQLADDVSAQRAALIIVANAKLDHFPTSSFKCYSDEGLKGSKNSNLFLSGGSPVGSDVKRYINAWLIDQNIDSLGHRRWVIDPFIKSIALGVVDGEPYVPFPLKPAVGAALEIIGDSIQDNTDLTTEFVAYPYKDYPTALVDKTWFLSFSVIADKTSRFGDNQTVDFSGATVTIKSAQGAVSVDSIAFNNNGAGVANIFQWKAQGLADGVTYTVDIANVKVNSQPRSYSYDVTLK